jgi:Na+/H+ antiporter NhaD/arsenite permease-like protein
VIKRPRGLPEAIWTALGAAVVLALGLVSPAAAFETVAAGKGALLFLLALLVLAALVDRSGFFEWAAIHAARIARGDARALYRNVFVRELPRSFDPGTLPDPASVVPHRGYFLASSATLAIVLAGYFAAPFLGLEPYAVAGAGAAVLLLAGRRAGSRDLRRAAGHEPRGQRHVRRLAGDDPRAVRGSKEGRGSEGRRPVSRGRPGHAAGHPRRRARALAHVRGRTIGALEMTRC